jgi:Copper transport outer membrane protein, MctB
MISFRYHVVTIVAVLIALAVGILLGGTFIDTGLANGLTNQVHSLVADRNNLRNSIAQLTDENRDLAAFANQWMPEILSGRLIGVPVVIVTIQGVDLQAVASARQSLVQAGVTELETVELTSRMSSEDPADRQALSEAIGLPGPPPPDLDARVASALADRLLQAPPTGATDLLLQLQPTFLTIIGQPTVASIGLPGQAVVVIAGGNPPPSVSPGKVLLPLITALVERTPPAPVVAGEPTDTGYPFVGLIRASDIDRQLVTVDDVDQVLGQLSAAIGLRDLIARPGKGADYGIDPGASAPFPPP